MEQRSPEWHLARKGRVTGSNVGAILGLSPFMTRGDVMRMMVRDYHGYPKEFAGNPATEWGVANEAGALIDYSMDTGAEVRKASFVEYEDWLGASPDGYVGNDGLVEIKCPYGQRSANPPIFKTVDEQPHYYAQMQIQMLCTGSNWCDFYQWAPFGVRLDRVDRDDNFICKALIELRKFYDEFLEEVKAPERHLEDKLPSINTKTAEQLVTEYLELAEAEDLARERKKEILEKIVSAAGGQNCYFGGRKLSKVERDGSVSYAKAIKELAPGADLSKWTGKPTSYWTLK